MLYSGMVHGVRVGSMRRRVTTRESTIVDLRRENQRLREENARVRSELRGMDRGVAATRDPKGPGGSERGTRPAHQGTGRAPLNPGDRAHLARATPPPRPRT